MSGDPAPIGPPFPRDSDEYLPPATVPDTPRDASVARSIPPLVPPRRRGILTAIVVVVVVAVALVAVLALAGVFAPSKSSGQGLTGSPVSYSQVAPRGTGAVQNESGGPWRPVGAVGIGLTISASGSHAGSIVSSGCNSTPAPGSPSGGTLPATPTGAAAGSVALWMFLGADSAGDVLMVAVTANASVPLVILSGACTADYSGLGTIAGALVVNSTVIAGNADGNGGSTFLSSNPGAIQTFVLFGPGLPNGGPDVPLWAADYNTCGLATTGTGTAFVALYYGASGDAYGTPMTQTVDC